MSEVELRRNSAGRMLMARIYQPTGTGPFPVMLDLHGGAWRRKDRYAEEPMDRAIAAIEHDRGPWPSASGASDCRAAAICVT